MPQSPEFHIISFSLELQSLVLKLRLLVFRMSSIFKTLA